MNKYAEITPVNVNVVTSDGTQESREVGWIVSLLDGAKYRVDKKLTSCEQIRPSNSKIIKAVENICGILIVDRKEINKKEKSTEIKKVGDNDVLIRFAIALAFMSLVIPGLATLSILIVEKFIF